jgi:hypothetical protein
MFISAISNWFEMGLAARMPSKIASTATEPSATEAVSLVEEVASEETASEETADEEDADEPQPTRRAAANAADAHRAKIRVYFIGERPLFII